METNAAPKLRLRNVTFGVIEVCLFTSAVFLCFSSDAPSGGDWVLNSGFAAIFGYSFILFLIWGFICVRSEPLLTRLGMIPLLVRLAGGLYRATLLNWDGRILGAVFIFLLAVICAGNVIVVRITLYLFLLLFVFSFFIPRF